MYVAKPERAPHRAAIVRDVFSRASNHPMHVAKQEYKFGCAMTLVQGRTIAPCMLPLWLAEQRNKDTHLLVQRRCFKGQQSPHACCHCDTGAGTNTHHGRALHLRQALDSKDDLVQERTLTMDMRVALVQSIGFKRRERTQHHYL